MSGFLFNLKKKLSDFLLIPLRYEINDTDPLIRLENSKISWSGDDPNISVTATQGKKLTSGYYMLEASVTKSADVLVSKIYPDYGEGFSEVHASSIVIKPGKTVKRVVHFHESVKALRFDPSEQPGFLQDLTLSLMPLSDKRARQLIAKKLKLPTCPKVLSEEIWRKYNGFFSIDIPPSHTYDHWIETREPFLWLGKSKTDSIKFSIIVPTYNTKPEWLQSLFDSVLAQTYTNWELLFVDDCSIRSETHSELKNIALVDERVKVVFRSENGHISIASNTGLENASGDYVVFLDHDDFLSPHALNELKCAIDENPSVKFIYSDEDLVSEVGERITPHFKSDWNPDLLYSHNYITHISCYESRMLSEVGGFRTGVEGSQDYDLVLRFTRGLSSDSIKHIPKILYHWRMVEGSTAQSSDFKSYTINAGKKALSDFFSVVNPSVSIEKSSVLANYYSIDWPLPAPKPSLSIIIPTRNGLDVLKVCIDSLLDTCDYSDIEVVLVDNGSDDPLVLDYMDKLTRTSITNNSGYAISFIVVRDDGDFNFSRLINLGARSSSGEVLLLLNNDTQALKPGWMQSMVKHAVREDIGCVGAKLLYPDNTIQHAGVILGLGGYAAHSHRGIHGNDAGYFGRAQVTQNLSAVTAACLMITRKKFFAVGGFSEEFTVAYNDVDFCLKVVQSGYRTIYEPSAELYHYESKTRGLDTTPEKVIRFDKEKALLLERWKDIIENDPYYNPNLTRSNEMFSILNS